MKKSETDPRVDEYLGKAQKWQEEIGALRVILLESGLAEEMKWRAPCYTFQNGNVAIIQPFKEYCALMFFKGSLLKDPAGILKAPGEHSQAARQVRFTSVRNIVETKLVLEAYIREAIEVEKAGLKVQFRKSTELPVPEEFSNRLNELPKLKKAFEALTPGRQKAYLLYFSAPKQSVTRASRVEKSIPQILSGKGLNDIPG